MRTKKKSEWKLLGTFGVDSGQVMIVDPCYLDTFESNEFTANDKDKTRTKEFSYDGACRETISEDQGGELGRAIAVVSTTGYGDGLYEVHALFSDEGNWGKRIKELRIKFF